MTTLAEVIRRHGPPYLARYGGAMLPSHVRAMEAITGCRTAAMGGHLGQCDACGIVHLVHHSCRHRACAQCGHDTTARWIARHEDRLLPVPYFHLVFTLPAELRRVVRKNQSALLDVLFRAAFEALEELATDPRYLGARVGALAVLHTWTRTLEWHPHIHMLVPGGGLAPDGRTFRSARRPGRADFLVPVRPLAKLFRGRFLHLGRAALPHVPLPQIPWGKNWVVYAKRSASGPPAHLVEYLGRYIHRTAITDHRITACDTQSVTFTYRDSRTASAKSSACQVPSLSVASCNMSPHAASTACAPSASCTRTTETPSSGFNYCSEGPHRKQRPRPLHRCRHRPQPECGARPARPVCSSSDHA